MSIQPVGSVHPAFARWIERRRQRVAAQVEAIGDERFGDLARLIEDDDQDRPPDPQNEEERAELERMLADSRDLASRMAKVRARLLVELRDVERKQVSGHVEERRSERGGVLDGYL